MRQIYVEGWLLLEEETLNKIQSNSPPGGWFPALQLLSWYITESNLPWANLFFSPHLKRIFIYTAWSWDFINIIPPAILSTLTSIISTLPTSSLELMSVDDGQATLGWPYFKDSFSSFILRCGPSFTAYNSPVPLSDAALDHLIHLPHLHTWRVHGPPPTYPTSSLPLVFPPIRELTLGDGAACGWLLLLRRLEGGASTTQGVTPLSKAKESLKFLNLEDTSDINIDPSFVSTIQCFRNLVRLNADDYYHHEYDNGQCNFKLNNDHVTELAMALTQLESLLLGYPCSENTCLTTVACLLPISVHCGKLEELMIHFNTTNIVDDLRNISEDPLFQQLRSLPRRPPMSLDVHRMPLKLHESDFETVAKGMVDIFPSLTSCKGLERGWDEISGKIKDLQEHSG